MKILQNNFTAGEISPMLHARVDLAKYRSAAARLENFVVLPQGGVMRRPNFTVAVSAVGTSNCLVPFRFDSNDTMLLVFNGTSTVRVIRRVGETGSTFSIPSGEPVYASADLSKLRYAQNGNMMVFAHPNYPPCILQRKSLTAWDFKRLEIVDGAWLAGSGKKSTGETLQVFGPISGFSPDRYWFFASGGSLPDLKVGDIFKADLTLGGELTDTVPGYTTNYRSGPIIVKGIWEFATSGRNWAWTIYIEKTYDDGVTWYLVKTYNKEKDEDGNNTLFTGVEDEDDVVYHVRAEMNPADSADLIYHFVVQPFVKTFVFRVISDFNPATANSFYGELLSNPPVSYNLPVAGVSAVDWAVSGWSGWGGGSGSNPSYPAAVAFYQDRLVFAGSRAEPQTIWMSKVNDYKNFSVSDPLRDDDAITLTLAGGDSDGIHSLVAMDDLLVFTGSGEWKIAGSGENGAIAPDSVVAHLQTRIGSKAIQPIVVGNSVIFVQAQGTEVHTLGYNLQIDGYSGSNLSILSSHLFNRQTSSGQVKNEIVSMAYQQTPLSILWFALSDGTMATCTYQPEHEVIGWARQVLKSGDKASQVCALPSMTNEGETNLFAVVSSNGGSNHVDRLNGYYSGLTLPDLPSRLITLSSAIETEDGDATSLKAS